jgi:hypothetical protein
MPMVDFNFGGRFSGVTVKEAYDRQGKKVDVTNLTDYELALSLNRGDLTINLTQCLEDHVECQVDMQGFTASRFRKTPPQNSSCT